VSQYALFNLMLEMASRIEIIIKGSIGMYACVKNVDTSPDTKRSVRSVRDDSHVRENSIISVLVGWCGCPFTPTTGVQIPLGTPLKKNNGLQNKTATRCFCLCIKTH
jgi:hypothetical protein